jgi:hypothetical protein
MIEKKGNKWNNEFQIPFSKLQNRFENKLTTGIIVRNSITGRPAFRILYKNAFFWYNER